MRGDKSDNTAVAHRIDGFHKEIIMQCPRTLPPYRVYVRGESRVEQRYIPVWDIAGDNVIIAVIFTFNALKSLCPDCKCRVKMFQDKGCQGVFLETGYLC